ncbi:MAG TPA: protein-glutamine glutaminase family protein [Chlamydiales bacterium]|nr:protein-glutamine glutaminase family protein [Chlamydiales bacterium]
MTLPVQIATSQSYSVVPEEEEVLEVDKPKVAFFQALKNKEFFQDFSDRFAKTTHGCFRAICEKLGGIVKVVSKDPELPKMIQTLLDSRKKYQETLVPVCTSCVGEFPTIVMMPKSEVTNYSRLKNGNIYLSPTAYGQYIEKQYHQPKLPTTKEELDAFVRMLLSHISGFIPLENTRKGCNRRAQLLIDVLALYGFPQEKMGKQYIHFPGGHHWSYHVAPTIAIDIEGRPTTFLIDFSTSSTQALSLDEWISNLKEEDGKKTINQIAGIKRPGDWVSLDSKNYSTYRTGIDTIIRIQKNTAEILQLGERERDQQLAKLVSVDYNSYEQACHRVHLFTT